MKWGGLDAEQPGLTSLQASVPMETEERPARRYRPLPNEGAGRRGGGGEGWTVPRRSHDEKKKGNTTESNLEMWGTACSPFPNGANAAWIAM